MQNDIKQETMEILNEVINISIQNAISGVSSMLDAHITIDNIAISVIHSAQLALQMESGIISVNTNYTNDYAGLNSILFVQDDAKALLAHLMDNTGGQIELDDFGLSAFGEIAIKYQQGFTNSLSNFLGKTIKCERPKATILDAISQGLSPFHGKILAIYCTFNTVKKPITFKSFFDYTSFEQLIESSSKENRIVKEVKVEQKEIKQTNVQEEIKVKEVKVPIFNTKSEPLVEPDKEKNLDLIMNVPLNVSIEIGKTKKKIREIMNFSQGYVLELEKQTGAPVDIVVNGQLIARGDVVVIDENFAVRVTEIVSTVNLIPNE